MADSLPKHGYLIAVLQIIFLILFAVFVRYSPDADARFHPASSNQTANEVKHLEKEPDGNAHASMYPMFQDVHVMIFIGFGFLMTFLKRYGFSAVGLNFLVAALCLQWAILVNGFFHLHHGLIHVNLTSLLSADFVAAAVLISYGAVIGKTTPMQLVVMLMIEIPIFVINEVIGRKYLGAIDMGDSMFVHAFGAYFGLAVSFALQRSDCNTPKEGSSYRSDLFAMIGTVFLWLYWPSFNGAAATGDDQHRAVINTYLALASCCVTAFAVSSLIEPNKKFDMVHIQNSTLAGGVAIGTSADLMIQPFGAVLVGIIAGLLSVVGYAYLTPLMYRSKIRLHDTCGVHNLHGMPGVLAGIIGAIMAAVASESDYGYSLYQIFPQRVPANLTGSTEAFSKIEAILPGVDPGSGLSGGGQAKFQIIALVVTLVLALVGGCLTGIILRFVVRDKLHTDELYEDQGFWLLEESEESELESVGSGAPMTKKGTRVAETIH